MSGFTEICPVIDFLAIAAHDGETLTRSMKTFRKRFGSATEGDMLYPVLAAPVTLLM